MAITGEMEPASRAAIGEEPVRPDACLACPYLRPPERRDVEQRRLRGAEISWSCAGECALILTPAQPALFPSP